MCAGDISLDYWAYDPETKQDYLKVDVPHVCRDFDAIKEWAEKNKPVDSLWLTPEEIELRKANGGAGLVGES